MICRRSAIRVAAACLLVVCLGIVTGGLHPGSVQSQGDTFEAPYEGGTWSIVAIDQTTGDVGVAAATCLPVDVTALAALAPGKGAASVQADFEVDNRNALLQRLDQGERADDIVAALTSPEHDENHARRQYGVVTMHDDGVVTAGFSGEHTSRWKGRADSVEHAVTVQGNFLTGPEVVENALAAFVEPRNYGVMLADRLMRALEAGSAAGGDWRCNDHGVIQTSISAFLSVSRADQPPFAARHLGDTGTDYAEYPWIHLSVVDVDDGANPIVALRQEYDYWRAENMPPCEACAGLPIEAPQGGDGTARSDAPAVGPPTEEPEGSGVPSSDAPEPTTAEETAAEATAAELTAAEATAAEATAAEATSANEPTGAVAQSGSEPVTDEAVDNEQDETSARRDDDGPPTGAIVAIFVAVGGGLIATFVALWANKEAEDGKEDAGE